MAGLLSLLSPPQEESVSVFAALRRPLRVRQEEPALAQRLRQGLLLHAHRQGREADQDQVREREMYFDTLKILH